MRIVYIVSIDMLFNVILDIRCSRLRYRNDNLSVKLSFNNNFYTIFSYFCVRVKRKSFQSFQQF